jgi:hypothetical protein
MNNNNNVIKITKELKEKLGAKENKEKEKAEFIKRQQKEITERIMKAFKEKGIIRLLS